MTQYYKIKEKDFDLILKYLLEKGIVNKVISGTSKRSIFSINPVTVSDPGEISFPLKAYFVNNFDRINSTVKYLHKRVGGALKEKIAAVCHPCDLRGLIELHKILQVNLDNIFKIVLVDLGVIPARDIQKKLKADGIDESKIKDFFLTPDELLIRTEEGEISLKPEDGIAVTPNCARCTGKVPTGNFDIAVSYIGTEPFSGELIIYAGSPTGEEVIKNAGIELNPLPEEEAEAFKKKTEEIIAKSEERRKEDIGNFLKDKNRYKALAKCTMCGVCINACPVCFCVACTLQAQRREKSIDNLSYQLTRIAHVADRCVECGKCDLNCPVKLPLSLYFQSGNDIIADEFGYIAGKDPSAKPLRSSYNIA